MKRFVSDIDRIMALIYEDQPLPPPVPKGAVSFPAPEPFVRKERIPLKRQKKEPPKPPELQLDFASLAKIRTDAELTMNKLITEDELEEEVCEAKESPSQPLPADGALTGGALQQEAKEAAPPAAYGLSTVEAELLLTLLKGDNVSEFDTGGQMLSVLVDQINEKLFDEFADTVIENGMPPAPLPDYEEDLKAMFL